MLAGFSSTIANLSWLDVSVGVAVFVVTLLVNVILLGVVLLMLPPTYLLDDHAHRSGIPKRIVRNLVGVALVVIGILTSLPGVPGQGLLTMAIGLLLMDVPGKRRLARAILHRGAMLDRINRLRRRFGIAPLILARDVRAGAGVA